MDDLINKNFIFPNTEEILKNLPDKVPLNHLLTLKIENEFIKEEYMYKKSYYLLLKINNISYYLNYSSRKEENQIHPMIEVTPIGFVNDTIINEDFLWSKNTQNILNLLEIKSRYYKEKKEIKELLIKEKLPLDLEQISKKLLVCIFGNNPIGISEKYNYFNFIFQQNIFYKNKNSNHGIIFLKNINLLPEDIKKFKKYFPFKEPDLLKINNNKIKIYYYNNKGRKVLTSIIPFEINKKNRSIELKELELKKPSEKDGKLSIYKMQQMEEYIKVNPNTLKKVAELIEKENVRIIENKEGKKILYFFPENKEIKESDLLKDFQFFDNIKNISNKKILTYLLNVFKIFYEPLYIATKETDSLKEEDFIILNKKYSNNLPLPNEKQKYFFINPFYYFINNGEIFALIPEEFLKFSDGKKINNTRIFQNKDNIYLLNDHNLIFKIKKEDGLIYRGILAWEDDETKEFTVYYRNYNIHKEYFDYENMKGYMVCCKISGLFFLENDLKEKFSLENNLKNELSLS